MQRILSRSATQAIVLCALGVVLSVAPRVNPADHGDAPIASNNQSTDIADVFAFLDPNDNDRLILAMTQRGFIAAGENVNFGIFDQFLQYRIQLELTGDAQPDAFIDITFTPVAGAGGPQTATIELPSGRVFTALTTRSSIAPIAPEQVVTEDPATGIKFFAGLVDDPFFFDIPANNRFIASVRAGTPDPTVFQRGRDSFAGYNVMGIALSIPLKGPDVERSLCPQDTPVQCPPDVLGVSGVIMRNENTRVFPEGIGTSGKFRQVERMGNPTVNVVIIPFSRKDEHNFATQEDDAHGQFADDIVSNLTSLGTNEATIAIFIDLLVTTGDYLRLNTCINPNNCIANTGSQGGTNPEAAFPNGRRLADDTVDTALTLIANGNPLGDNVNASDVPPANTFPFFAPSQQPRDPGVIDDNTRN
jgi:hypothetical protein